MSLLSFFSQKRATLLPIAALMAISPALHGCTDEEVATTLGVAAVAAGVTAIVVADGNGGHYDHDECRDNYRNVCHEYRDYYGNYQRECRNEYYNGCGYNSGPNWSTLAAAPAASQELT